MDSPEMMSSRLDKGIATIQDILNLHELGLLRDDALFQVRGDDDSLDDEMIEEESQEEGSPGFEEELESLINRYSKENESNTPDFILAEYLSGVLNNFNMTVLKREQWYGRGSVGIG